MLSNLLLSGIALEIATLLVLSRKVSRGPKFLFTVLSLFWFFNFFMRPLVFIYSRNNGIDSAVYDYRIGENEKFLNEILFSIFFGCFIFFISIFFLSILPRTAQSRQVKIVQDKEYSSLIYICFICGYASILLEGTALRNPFSKSLTELVSIIFSTYLWKRSELCFSKKKDFYILLVGAVGTLVLSVSASRSKGMILLPLLVFLSTLRVWKRGGSGTLRLFLAPVVVFGTIQLFSKLQAYKLGGVSVSLTNRNIEDLPWFFSSFLVLINRFDQFARVTDVYSASPNPIGSYRSWFNHLLLYLQWNPGQERTSVSFGQEWNQLVTTQSISEARFSNVSLAQGMIGEGLVWAGFVSLILECIVVAVIFIWIGKLLDRGPLSVVFAFGLISNATVFEMGLVQFSEIFSGSAKILLFLWVAKKFYKFIGRDSRRETEFEN